MRLSDLIVLLFGCLLLTATVPSALAEQPVMPEETTAGEGPEGGYADDGGTGFHGLKTLDAPLHETEGTIDPHAARHGGEHKKGLPQFDPTSFPSQLFWLAVMFAILYTFFSKKTLPDIAKTLQKRQAHIEHDIATAQRLRESAEEAKGRYDRAVAEAQDKSTKLYLKAEEEVKAKIAAGLEEFKSRASLQIKDTEDSIEKAKKEALDSIQSIAAEIASVAAEKIVGISTDINQAKDVVRNINKKAA
jgi:F-type H+-transporting ATPase subunit b